MLRILEDRRNPFVGSIFRELRSPESQRDRHRFRENLRILGLVLGYEIAGTLAAKRAETKTPLGVRELDVLESPPVLCAILRAALPFWDGMLEVFRESDSMIVAAARREGSAPGLELEMPVDLSYRAVPNVSGKDWILVDPMLATGSTLIGVYRQLLEHGLTPRRVIVASAIAYRGALARVEKSIPNVDVWAVAVDDELNERGYIVPGLGDAGDLCYGEKR